MDSLPTELFVEILEHLVPIEGGLYDLSQSSLACKSWRVPTQRVIFRHIHILYLREWARLKKLVQSNQAIGSYLLSLHFELIEDPDDVQATALFPNVTAIAFTCFVRAPRLGFASRFPSLNSVQIKVQILRSWGYKDKNEIPRAILLGITPRVPGMALRVLRCPYRVLEDTLI
jgi:hypothetical protein